MAANGEGDKEKALAEKEAEVTYCILINKCRYIFHLKQNFRKAQVHWLHNSICSHCPDLVEVEDNSSINLNGLKMRLETGDVFNLQICHNN